MNNLVKFITNLTIKDFAMLALSIALLFIISLATCHKEEHSAYEAVSYAQPNNEEQHIDNDMDEFWGKTQEKNASEQNFGEPMDELVNALTSDGHNVQPQLNEEESIGSIDTPEASKPEIRESDIEEIITEAEESAELNDTQDDLIADIEQIKTNNTIEEASDAVIVDAVNVPTEIHEKLDACVDDDSKTISSPVIWRTYLKKKIKTLLNEDEDSECIDVLLEELYLNSSNTKVM